MSPDDEEWVPEVCTLPTAERPLRVAEFDELFTTALRGQTRLSSTAARWEFAVSSAAVVRDLIERESDCCSFFTFLISTTDDAVLVDVRVPVGHETVLDGLTDRAGHRGTVR
ncbi:hypothetical protein [Micromonospora sp. IBHARD004]|uniref:hypothetical protein n=1 Tax=Micromonospora sp. IBHARD004 TaxID=3457764 RepID=UPI004059FE6F